MNKTAVMRLRQAGMAIVAITGLLVLILQCARVTAGDKSTAVSNKSTTTSQSSEKVGKSGSQLWSENCARCHNMRSPSTYSDSEWEVVMHHMRVRSPLAPEEHKKILEFLKSAN